MNNCILIGRITKDLELKTGSVSHVRFNLAVNSGRDKEGNDITAFPTIVAFGKTAENLCKYMSKGSQLAVNCSVRTGSYKDKGGKTVYTTEFFANNIEFLSKAEKSDRPSEPNYDDAFSSSDEPIPF